MLVVRCACGFAVRMATTVKMEQSQMYCRPISAPFSAMLVIILSGLFPVHGAGAQVTKPDPMAGMAMGDSSKRSMKHASEMQMFEPLGVSMNRMGSGTTWVPDAAPLPAMMTMARGWDLTSHGFVFVQ